VTDPMVEIQELKREVARLKQVVKELTEALNIMSEKDKRAKEFVLRVQELLDD
jgi:archaellum component FlaC